MSDSISDARVFTVYSWFKEEMKQVGRNIKLPKCKDQTKTYQFRWTKSFVLKCQEMGLTDSMMKMLISDVVKYAEKQKILNKGTQILTIGNIVDICVRGLEELAKSEDSLVQELRSCQLFLADKFIDKNNLVRGLVESRSEGCSNLFYWYNLGYITEVYMALSKSCNSALSKLPKQEQDELPSKLQLLRVCTHTVSPDLLPSLEKVLGSDLRIPPTAIFK